MCEGIGYVLLTPLPHLTIGESLPVHPVACIMHCASFFLLSMEALDRKGLYAGRGQSIITCFSDGVI